MNNKGASSMFNQNGLAMVETIPLLVIFVVLLSFGLGLFGAIHTAILNSIGARTYSFDVFRQRTNLTYFRENGSGLTKPLAMNTIGWRFHGVTSDDASDPNHFEATARGVALGRAVAAGDSNMDTNNQKIYSIQARNTEIGVNPIWVMVGYGICLNSACGD